MNTKRVLVLGGSGTIGQAVVAALVRLGYDAVCLVRPPTLDTLARQLPGARWRAGDVTDQQSLSAVLGAERFDAVISCLASRTGAPADAWAIDHQAHVRVLAAAQHAGVAQMVLLSAICVQKPLLAFQQAKLAFEQALIASGLKYSIVRPTAFFKSLTGQIERVRAGKAFLVFGDGRLTRCKPISDGDLAAFMVRCLSDETLQRRVLPIGGPGAAITPLEQGEALFRLLGRKPRFRHVPLGLLDAIIGALGVAGRFSRSMAGKAELARIGRYYASESMLVLDPDTGQYDEQATPSTGQQTLIDFYRAVLDGRERLPDRGEHAVF
jgi:divinyl chlorophyllide a 8-vinyl-reductase